MGSTARGSRGRSAAEVGAKFGRGIPQPRPGEHLWIVLGMWLVNDPTTDDRVLEVGDLLTVEGPGCWVCEQPWNPSLTGSVCPGEPA
jgi:hypothetical protein